MGAYLFLRTFYDYSKKVPFFTIMKLSIDSSKLKIKSPRLYVLFPINRYALIKSGIAQLKHLTIFNYSIPFNSSLSLRY